MDGDPPTVAEEARTHVTGVGLPTGFVTFVLSDIEGSTRLLKRLPERAADIFDRHDELLRTAWAEHGGREVSTEGDSFFVAFADLDAAMAASMTAQRLLAEEPWPDGGTVRVRIGIHAGYTTPRGDNYVSLAIHQAARVAAAANGGQILVTNTVAETTTAHGERLHPLGRFRLRDFDEPELLFRLESPGAPVIDTAIRATPAERHNLVTPPTTFVGRSDEVGEVIPLLAPGRAVTLTGPGGVGKTRLATAVGLAVVDDWIDGVWLADLSDVSDSALVSDRIAEAVGTPAGDSGMRWRDVIAHLESKAMLLVLDNVETHLDVCGPIVSELIARCPGIAVLSTGREPLKIAGETVYRLRPLEVPRRDEVDLRRIRRSPAVRLFCDRGRAARPSFELDDDSAPAAAAVCARLDGLPLALEIAGARIGVLNVGEILDGLDDRFALLRTRDRSLPERQRTMEGLLDWSYQLLDDVERAAFRRLAVFGGTFTIDSATQALADDEIPAAEVPELVWALVDKSLVVADLSEAETRYRLPESVREYAHKLSDEAGDSAVVATRLARWFRDEIGPGGTVDRRWISRVGVELDNLRALISALALVEPELAQQLAYTIGRFHDSLQAFASGIAELGSWVTELASPTPSRVALLTGLADLHLRLADIGAAEDLLREADRLQSEVGAPPWTPAAVDRTRGEIATRSGHHDDAIAIAVRALETDHPIRDRARMWSMLGIARYANGDMVGAADAFEHELEAYERLGHDANIATSHGNVAAAAMRLGDEPRAARHQQRCLELALALDLPVMRAFSSIVAARIAANAGDWALAVRLHARADADVAEIGMELYDSDLVEAATFRDAAVEALDHGAYEREVAAGRSLDMTEAVDLARTVLARAAASGRRHPSTTPTSDPKTETRSTP